MLWLCGGPDCAGKADPSALRESLYGGYGGALAGAMGGAAVGGVTHGLGGMAIGMGIGGLVCGVGELVAGSLVKDVTFTIVTDLMIPEKSADKFSLKLLVSKYFVT